VLEYGLHVVLKRISSQTTADSQLSCGLASYMTRSSGVPAPTLKLTSSLLVVLLKANNRLFVVSVTSM